MITLKSPDAPATRKQLWALFCATKRDHRNDGLTMQAASDLIGQLKEKNMSPKEGNKSLLTLLQKADQTASKTYEAFVSANYKTPAIAIIGEDSTVVGQMNDVCGHVWLEVAYRKGKDFLSAFKREGVLSIQNGKRWTLGSFTLRYSNSSSVWSSPWRLFVPSVGYGNGAMSAMEAAGRAFSQKMEELGYPGIDMRSMID